MNCTNDANTAGPSAPMDQSRFLNRFDATKPLSARARRGQIRYPSRQPLRPTIARRSGSRRNGYGKDVPRPGIFYACSQTVSSIPRSQARREPRPRRSGDRTPELMRLQPAIPILDSGPAFRDLLQLEQFPQPLRLHAANGNLRLLLVSHLQHVATLEPGHHFLDVMDIHQVRAVRTPERFGIERLVQVFQGPVVGGTFRVARHHGNEPVIDRSEKKVFRVYQQQALLRFHEQLGRLRGLLARAKLSDKLLESLGRSGLRLHHFAGTLDGFRNARPVEWLQNVVHGVHVERLHRVMIERRGEDHVRHLHFALYQFSQDAEAVQTWHLHVEKYQIGGVLLDQGHGLDAVLALADDINFRKAFEQEREFVASGFLVVDDDGVDGHGLSIEYRDAGCRR